MQVKNYDAKQEEEEAKKFELLPIGQYNVVIEKSEDKVSDSGKNYTGYEFRIIDTDLEGRIIFYNLYESSIFNKIIFAMSRCFDVQNINDTAKDFIGKTGTINYAHKDYEGSPRGEINPFRGFIPKTDSTPVTKEPETEELDEKNPF